MSETGASAAHYGPAFYEDQQGGSAESARAVVPFLMEVLSPASVLDVGCGIGTWVKAFADAGAAICHGIDGPWARKAGLVMPDSDFREFDFMAAAAPFHPVGLLDRYELLTSFEFVEHLSAGYAPALADFFISKADCVVIGCAVPGQGGQHHVNEQWPTYWAKLMADRGYVACDFIRPAVWNDDRVDPWYRQNMVGYFRGRVPPNVLETAQNAWNAAMSSPLPLVHPRLFQAKCERASPNFGNLVGIAHEVARAKLRSLIGRSATE